MTALLHALTTRRLALPVYVLAYRYRDKLYRAVISGQRARVAHGSAPYSIAKIATTVALTIGALGGIVWLLSM